MNNNGIAVAGSILVDEINVVSAYPEIGELTQIKSVSKSVGGCVSNVAVDLKKLSGDLPVYATGKVGRDDRGNFVISLLQNCGINTENIVASNTSKTSFTQVISVLGGQRTFFTYPGASADYDFSDINFNNLNVKILHLGYFLLLEKIDNGDGIKILKEAKENGIETSIDLVSENSDRYSLILPCLKYVDYLIINEIEGGKLTNIDPIISNIPKIAEKLFELGVNKKVIIHFKEGSVCCSKSGITVFGGFVLPDGYIKGTTGAGDAFCAGALIGIYNGLNDNEILEYGTYAAAVSLAAEDAVSGLTSIESAKKICKEFERNNLCL